MDGPGQYSVFRLGRIRHLFILFCTYLHPARVGGFQFTMTQRPLSFFVVCAYPIHSVMVNWDPPISQVLHLPDGTIQNCIPSIYWIRHISDITAPRHVGTAGLPADLR